VKIARKILTSLAKICDRKPGGRYALSAVRLEREDADGRPVAVACDGRRLLAVTWCERPGDRDAADGGQPLQIPANTIEDLLGRLRDRPGLEESVDAVAEKGGLRLRYHAGRGSRTGASTSINQTEGPYPKWRQQANLVTPDLGGYCPSFVDPRLLGELLLAIADAATDDANRGVVLWCPAEPGEPLYVAADRHDRAAWAAIMPMASGNDEHPALPRGSHRWRPAAEPKPEPKEPDADEDPATDPPDQGPGSLHAHVFGAMRRCFGFSAPPASSLQPKA